jgi:hypothetical protein
MKGYEAMNKKELMYKRIEKHGEDLKRIFNLNDADPVKLCKQLKRLETKTAKVMVDYCNGVVDTAFIEEYRQGLTAKISKIIGKENIEKVYINQDPRGYALKLNSKESGLHNAYKDWGGYVILAPDFN